MLFHCRSYKKKPKDRRWWVRVECLLCWLVFVSRQKLESLSFGIRWRAITEAKASECIKKETFNEWTSVLEFRCVWHVTSLPYYFLIKRTLGIKKVLFFFFIERKWSPFEQFIFFKNFPTKGTDPFNSEGYVTRTSCTIWMLREQARFVRLK